MLPLCKLGKGAPVCCRKHVAWLVLRTSSLPSYMQKCCLEYVYQICLLGVHYRSLDIRG